MNLMKLVQDMPVLDIQVVHDPRSGAVSRESLPRCTGCGKTAVRRQAAGQPDQYVCRGACRAKDGDGPLVIADAPEKLFVFTAQYLENARVEEVIQDALMRKAMISPTGERVKAMIPSRTNNMVAVGKAMILAWRELTVKGARALHATLHLAGLPDDQPIPFSNGVPNEDDDNLRAMLEHSDFRGLVEATLGDHKLFFPHEETQEKNSEPGPSGSSTASRARSAGTTPTAATPPPPSSD